MKIITLLLLMLSSHTLSSQVVYQGADESDFKDMIRNGINFLPSSFENRDSLYIAAFEKHWKVSDFEVVDMEDNDLTEDDIVVFETYLDSREHILALIRIGDISANRKTSKYKCIAYLCLNGFSGADDIQVLQRYSEMLVKGFNDAIDVVVKNDITSGGTGLYRRIYEHTLPKSVILKTKTLLINEAIAKYVDIAALTKRGISHKVISSQQFDAMPAAERQQSCMMYFALNSYAEISIFDLESSELIYTRHYAGAKRKFSASDIAEIAALWK